MYNLENDELFIKEFTQDINKNTNFIKEELEALAKAKAQIEIYTKSKVDFESKIDILEQKTEIIRHSQLMLLESGRHQRERIKAEFEELVTRALQYIMQEDIYFEIELTELRNMPHAEFYIKSIRNGEVTKTTITDSRGDGIADIVSLALAIVLYVSHKGNRGPLIFDEPCRQVSEKYKEGVGMFLKDIANGYNIQIIIITHIATYINCADQALNVYLKGTVSQVEEININ